MPPINRSQSFLFWRRRSASTRPRSMAMKRSHTVKRLVHILLDQKDGAAGRFHLSDDRGTALRRSSGPRPSLGSSISNSLGVPTITRAMASICCSPPDRVVPFWRRRSGQAREALVDVFQSRLACGARAARHLQKPSVRFSSTLRPGKIRRSSGTRPTPGAQCDRTGRRCAVPPKSISPCVGFTQPAMAFSSVVLPTPLRPKMPNTSPAADRDVDALDHRARAVVRVQVADVEHRQACPEIGGLHGRIVAHVGGAPSASFWP